jgi:hypothetical protein
MNNESYEQVLALSRQLLDKNQGKLKTVTGAEFDMEPATMIVAHSVKVGLEDGEYVRVHATTPDARPPFEWLLELTTLDDHFLLFDDGRLVRAVKKDLFPLKPGDGEWLIGQLGKAIEASQ